MCERSARVSRLVVLGVEHDTESSTHGLRGQTLGEQCANGAIVAMSLHDAAPDDSVLRVLLDGASFVDIGHTLPEVVRGRCWVVHVFQT